MTELMDTWLFVGPLLIVAFGGLAMMLVDAFAEKSELAIVSAVVFLAGAAVSLGLLLGGPQQVEAGPIGGFLAYDRLTDFLDLVICGAGAISALLAGGYLREHRLERGEFYVILVFSAFGAMALASSVDLISLFISLEIMSLGMYGLVAFRRASPRAAEAGLKYFLLGSFASAILLFGLALLYGATGHTNLAEIHRAVASGDPPTALLVMSMLLITVGLAFKVSAVPFHAWAPDAYEGAVTPAATYMAVVVKVAVLGVMIRVFTTAFGDDSLSNDGAGWPPALLGLAAISIVVANLAGLVQKNVKRMLAYSSVSHAGFVLLGLVAAFHLHGGFGLDAVLYYLAAYTVSNLLAFGSLIALGSYGKEAVSYEDIAGAGRRHPWIGVPFSLGILSLMGFPPLAGFFGKYYVLLAAVQSGGALLWVAVLAVLMSVVGAYYYLLVLVYLFMKKPEKGAPVAVPMKSGYVVGALVIASYFVIRLGVSPDVYLGLIQRVRGVEVDLDWVTYLIDGGVAVTAGGLAAAIASMRRSGEPAEDAEASAEAAGGA